VWINSLLIKSFVLVEDVRKLYLCNVSFRHRALIKIIVMPMKEDDFKERKGMLEGLFMRYSSLINNRSGRDKELIMKNIDVILDWYNDLLKQKEE
jgi:hypothetical protein